VKILVTGGAGYIGSVCVEDLLNRGHDVTVFDNLTEGHRKAVDQRAKFVQGDLADKTGISQVIGTEQPAAVMHFAAKALVGESMQNPSKYFFNNVSCGLNLLDAMVEHGGKTVRVFIDLRDLRDTRSHTDRRTGSPKAGESLWRIKADFRENPKLV